VRAYYQIAASRFADNICLGIQSRLFASCGREMEDAVTLHLGTGEDSSMAFPCSPCFLLADQMQLMPEPGSLD